jgi:hypothetical protein
MDHFYIARDPFESRKTGEVISPHLTKSSTARYGARLNDRDELELD